MPENEHDREERHEGHEVLEGMTGVLLLERITPAIQQAIHFGAERHDDPGEGGMSESFKEWCNGAIYGIVSVFGRGDKPVNDPKDTRALYAGVCRLMDKIEEEHAGDLDAYGRALLARVGVEVSDEPPARADAEEEAALDPATFVQRIREAGVGLLVASKAVLESYDGKADADLLSLLRMRAYDATRLVWHVESDLKSEKQPEGWGDIVADNFNVLQALPTIVLALDAPSLTEPDAVLPNFDLWRCPTHVARRAGEVIVAWADAHAAEEVAHV